MTQVQERETAIESLLGTEGWSAARQSLLQRLRFQERQLAGATGATIEQVRFQQGQISIVRLLLESPAEFFQPFE